MSYIKIEGYDEERGWIARLINSEAGAGIIPPLPPGTKPARVSDVELWFSPTSGKWFACLNRRLGLEASGLTSAHADPDAAGVGVSHDSSAKAALACLQDLWVTGGG